MIIGADRQSRSRAAVEKEGTLNARPHADPALIERQEFRADELVRQFPPRITHPNKRVIYEIASPPGSRHDGVLTFSRWRARRLPAAWTLREGVPSVTAREGHFRYEPASGNGTLEWTMNFADADLFSGYGGPLAAQDELQVAEHPALASLREALLALDLDPWTVEDAEPTPILVAGVERRCAIDTGPNRPEGRPSGLYGIHFDSADAAAVRRAARVLDPPTVSHILAMEAPPPGVGRYSAEEIRAVLRTAYAGFRAACLESLRLAPAVGGCAISTGFWGCGAYGGNRILMTVLQAIAGAMAGVDRLVFHTADEDGARAHASAMDLLLQLLPAESGTVETEDLIEEIESLGLTWGESDGN